MDTIFLFKITISFFISGFWIAFATLFAERLGSKMGGLITNLPSNILISFLFVAIIHNIDFVINAVPGIPIGMAIDTLFLFVFIVLLKYGLVISTIASLVFWFALAEAAASMNFNNLLFNVIIYIIITVITFIVLEKMVKIPSKEKTAKSYTKTQIMIRAFFAGSIVTSVIILSKIFNPYIVGIFATFPAVLLSTMIILVLNQNKMFARATGKVLIISSSNIVIYGLAIYFTYPTIGIVLGTMFSFLMAFLWVWLLRPIVQRAS